MGTTRVWKGNDSSTPNDYSVVGNWDTPVGANAVPEAGDTVVIPPGSGSITAGLAQSGVELISFRVEPGYNGRIGIRGTSGAGPTYLQIDLLTDTGICELSTTNYCYLNIGSADTDVTVFSAAGGTIGACGTCLVGTAIQTLSVHNGYVALAAHTGNLADCDDIQLRGNSLLYRGAGAGSSAATIMGGTLLDAGGITQCDIYSGRYRSIESAPLTTLNVYGGSCVLNSTDTVGTVNLKGTGASVDLTQSGLARTITNFNYDEGRLVKTPATTITNFNISSLAFNMSCSTLR